MMLELVRRNPHDLWHSENLKTTQRLFIKGQSGRTLLPVGTGSARVLVYDAKTTTRLPGTKARFEGDPAVKDNVLNSIYDYSLAVRKFHKEVLKINSPDNKGADYVNTGHYGLKYNNAFFNNVQMVFGDGDGTIFVTFVLNDIIGHEVGHWITAMTCALEYFGQSGALNEHLSDVDGVVFRQFLNKLTVDKDSWLIGPGIFAAGISGRALRDMLNPGTAYDDGRLGKDPQPAHMSNYLDTQQDNGGVHINSGIPNKAFALFANAVGGNAWENSYQVWWQLRKEISAECDFQTFADKSVEICKRMRPDDTQKLIDAWQAVGITTK
jgi:Zn-dependent metalloprotease